MNSEEKAKKAIEKLKNLAGNRPMKVFTMEESQAGFSQRCLKCSSSVIAIIPVRAFDEGEGVILSCMGCENTLVIGISNDDPIVSTTLKDLR